jgi:hypothetical protein
VILAVGILLLVSPIAIPLAVIMSVFLLAHAGLILFFVLLWLVARSLIRENRNERSPDRKK